MFDRSSGRPGGKVFDTPLLVRLRTWTQAFASGSDGPRIVLLVGGPGNGKTEAVEAAVGELATELGDDGLLPALQDAFSPADGIAPRLVRVGLQAGGSLSLVQDASVTAGGMGSPARQLVKELCEALGGTPRDAYLCCVNRGVLDDALIEATEHGPSVARGLLEEVTAAVGLQPGAPACWPLDGHPVAAAWPMDAESLVATTAGPGEPPAGELLDVALDGSRWLPAGTCTAGGACPFCASRARLSEGESRRSLLDLLRYFEVAMAKRWSFRDLFSLVSYLLAGHRTGAGQTATPCDWAARLAAFDKEAAAGATPRRETSPAIFHLVASQYQHALFHRWDREAGPSLLRDIRELGLEHDNTAMGLHWFLMSRRGQYLPAPIALSLEGLVDAMDPALTSPEAVLPGVEGRRVAFRDLDVRFSRSTGEGLEFVRRLGEVWPLELELLGRLARLDKLLSQPAVRRKRPQVASRVQRLARDFACRLARRTFGTHAGLVRDKELLAAFQCMVEDASGEELHDVARDVENLLNEDRDFEIPLTTTFGQPLPPEARRATLVVPARRVRPLEEAHGGRPPSPLPFLKVGDAGASRPLALTYELFKAVRELDRGMSQASLPTTVLALLDTARARLAGSIVHDPAALERARIVLGSPGLVIEERRRGFVAKGHEQ